MLSLLKVSNSNPTPALAFCDPSMGYSQKYPLANDLCPAPTRSHRKSVKNPLAPCQKESPPTTASLSLIHPSNVNPGWLTDISATHKSHRHRKAQSTQHRPKQALRQ